MATLVLLFKEFEDEQRVVYKFGPNDNSLGRIQLMKETGECTQLEPVPNTNTKFYFFSASSTLLKILREGKVFPERTAHAS